MADTPISPTDFAEAFKNFMVQVGKPATPPEAVFARHFRSHFEADPSKLPILAEEFRQFDHANVQIRKGLRFEVKNLEAIIKRTEGVSAAFIREMVRKAALAAADERDELVVEDRHLDEALHELLIEGGALTRSLLGAKPSERPV